jgi:hypothetical protein
MQRRNERMSGCVAGPVIDAYWRFAHERHCMWLRRLDDARGPWTADPILAEHRFTNAYRVLDRVSQHLLTDVQYGPGRSQAPAEVFFRTMLFKIFNRIETWTMIEERCGTTSWQSFDRTAVNAVMDEAMKRGTSLYSAAYIMPTPPYGHARKHANHLEMLERMMLEGLPARIAASGSLSEVYDLILAWPGIGPFLAFQYTIDLNYSSMIEHDEADFVVAGPGAHDGISKCFIDLGGMTAEAVIMRMHDIQEDEFARLGLPFEGLFGRRLKPIDLQNCFCETSKYTRVSHPEVAGIAGRTRIKQRYAAGDRPLPAPFLPPSWGLKVPERHGMQREPDQRDLF